jgi:hypothetical protein
MGKKKKVICFCYGLSFIIFFFNKGVTHLPGDCILSAFALALYPPPPPAAPPPWRAAKAEKVREWGGVYWGRSVAIAGWIFSISCRWGGEEIMKSRKKCDWSFKKQFIHSFSSFFPYFFYLT